MIVDGAHAVGSIPLDIPSYNADFYFSNFHKWGYGAKTGSLLFVNREFIEQTKPNIIGSHYGEVGILVLVSNKTQ